MNLAQKALQGSEDTMNMLEQTKNEISYDVLYFVLESVNDKVERRHAELV